MFIVKKKVLNSLKKYKAITYRVPRNPCAVKDTFALNNKTSTKGKSVTEYFGLF